MVQGRSRRNADFNSLMGREMRSAIETSKFDRVTELVRCGYDLSRGSRGQPFADDLLFALQMASPAMLAHLLDLSGDANVNVPLMDFEVTLFEYACFMCRESISSPTKEHLLELVRSGADVTYQSAYFKNLEKDLQECLLDLQEAVREHKKIDEEISANRRLS